jgi:hypothetical protein
MSLDVGGLYSGVVLTDAADIVEGLLAPDVTPDRISDLLEHAADDADRAHAVMFYLVLRCRGIPYGHPIADGLTAPHVHGAQLILPPGVQT